jgi:O-methyltransferase
VPGGEVHNVPLQLAGWFDSTASDPLELTAVKLSHTERLVAGNVVCGSHLGVFGRWMTASQTIRHHERVTLSQFVKRRVRGLLQGLGYEITRTDSRSPWPLDFQQGDIDLYEEVAPYTLTPPAAVAALADAVRHVCTNNVPGAIVECGVWRGGSMRAVARTLLDLGETDTDLYLFDTFEGMSEPTNKDVMWTGERADAVLARESKESNFWARAPLDQVREVMHALPYPKSKIHFVKGKVEETIPDQAPDEIALLRLDTDWYESTKHELEHLYPRLVTGGVLILDDYGWWRGAGRATDEYFQANGPAPLLVRIDHEGRRVGVKPDRAPSR